ncbi:MAG: GNAT family N-acetyltransferase [Bryobacteraceae bacterium]
MTMVPAALVFETARLRLRRLRAGDEEFLAVLDSNPVVMQYIHSGPCSFSRARRYAELEVQTAHAYRQTGKWIAELRDGTSIGWVQLFKLSSDKRDDVAIGYEFAPAYWGQGYATEANRRILEYAFEFLKWDRVVAIARPENLRSLRVLEKLGFQQIGQQCDEGGNLCNLYRVLPKDCA